MTRYVISDHHFGHANIIKYCDRPFTSVGQMDGELLNRHYETVEDDALLVHLGDVAMDMQDGSETIDYFERLGGDLLVRGNHDTGLDAEAAPFPVLESCTLEQGDYRFHCTHRPADVPDDWDGWVIHGHIHNNDTDAYPFVSYDDRRVNVSSDVLEFRPVSLDALTGLLDACSTGTHLRTIADAREFLDGD